MPRFNRVPVAGPAPRNRRVLAGFSASTNRRYGVSWVARSVSSRCKGGTMTRTSANARRCFLQAGFALAMIAAPQAASAGKVETVIHAFKLGGDGGFPYASLLADKQGNFTGTTQWGGTSTQCTNGCGTVFRLTADGAESVLYSFCPASSCADGEQ